MLTKTITSLSVAGWLQRLPFRVSPRLFSVSQSAWLSREEGNVRPEALREDTEEHRERRRNSQRLRRANPEYRERERAAQKLRLAVPEYREIRNARRRARRASPEYREESDALELQDRENAEPAHGRDLRQHSCLSEWVVRNEWVQGLLWETHTPVVHKRRTPRLCSGCGFIHYGGRRLWWRRKSDPKLYDCHDCFTKDWSRVMPRGFEDHVFGDLIRTRELRNRIRK